MSIFVLFRISEPAKVKAALDVNFPNDYLEVADAEFLVATNLTAEALSKKLKITDGTHGNGIVFAMGGYYGRASTDIWDWIKAKVEKVNG